MVRVTKEFISLYVENITENGSGHRLKKHIISSIRAPSGGFETNLSEDEKDNIEDGGRVTEFTIKVPGAYGWCGAKSYSAKTRPKTTRRSLQANFNSRVE